MIDRPTPLGNAARTIVRAPNHLGDVVMAIPALRQAAGRGAGHREAGHREAGHREAGIGKRESGGGADILIVRGLAPLLQMAGLTCDILPLDKTRKGFWRAVRAVRARRYERGILLPPSLSSALLFALGGVAHRRGTRSNHREALLQDAVPPESLARMHRASAYYTLVTGMEPVDVPVPSIQVTHEARERFRTLVPDTGQTTIGLFPGSNASSRRWDADRYASLARRLTRNGTQVLVFGGPAEQRLTAQVAGEAAVDLGGRTDLPMLAAGLAECALLVTNDSGPMHLAAAVGTPTLSMQGPADPIVTRPLGDGHVMLRHPELPCVPCVKNVCPRTGDKGFILPDGTRECLRLINVDDAIEALREHPATALTS